MCGSRTRCNLDCTLFAIIVSLIIGVITAFLSITAVITLSPVVSIVAFGIAIAYLALTLVTSASVRCASVQSCVCSILPVLLTGILGTVLTSVILLLIGFAATSVIGAIITGALAFFFSLMITTTACLVKCAALCPED